jgi:hypothetical protein
MTQVQELEASIHRLEPQLGKDSPMLKQLKEQLLGMKHQAERRNGAGYAENPVQFRR